jgi:hypothetical protein
VKAAPYPYNTLYQHAGVMHNFIDCAKQTKETVQLWLASSDRICNAKRPCQPGRAFGESRADRRLLGSWLVPSAWLTPRYPLPVCRTNRAATWYFASCWRPRISCYLRSNTSSPASLLRARSKVTNTRPPPWQRPPGRRQATVGVRTHPSPSGSTARFRYRLSLVP